MKTGISTASFFLRRNTEDAIPIIKKMGADVAEVFYATFYEYRPEFSEKYASRAAGLEINSVHALPTNYEPQLFNESRRTRGDAYYWLDQVMRSAQILGARYYTFHGYIAGKGGFGNDMDKLALYMNDILEFCSRYGVQLCMEDVAWCMYSKPGLFKELKKRCPNLWGVFDIKQTRRSGYPMNMYIEDMRGSLAYAHLSDVDSCGRVCLPGKGMYDFEEIIKRLKGTGFDGSLLIEVYPENYQDESEIKESMDYLKEIVYKLS
ncbi:MAG: sugar phosphate isomerase/epimerase [Clostridia bacterium]|nr:sugar phosphate isomerase/epimerase [Clostridia bacterium]